VARQARKLTEISRKMEENQRQLFSSHRLATVGRLAAGAAHEINNPLTIISLNLQILKRLIKVLPDNETLTERLQIISQQETRISNIIQDLMGFAKPTEPRFCPSDIAEIVAKALNLAKSRGPIANIRIDNQLPKNLPQVMVDPQQLEQVFLNLFMNSCQAMPQGGTMTISCVSVDDFIEITVADTGTGIAKKDLNKIFDPFFTTKMEGEGTGLGLAVCHAIVEHNQGTLRAVSTKGQGATFIVRLPQDKSGRLRQMKNILKTKNKKDTAKDMPEKCSILVVDDERILNEILQEFLRSAGFAVAGAFDGVEGLEKLRHGKYHVVLLDIRMPRKDGLAVLEFIKKEYPEVQVIIITGLASLTEIKETVTKGAFACLKKPFMLDKVLETIERAVKDQQCIISP
jgi:CheY-like chemotaxis protein